MLVWRWQSSKNWPLIRQKVIVELSSNISKFRKIESALGQAATRIATIFNSRLFNALLDIQDYYELHLHKQVNSSSLRPAPFDTFEVALERSSAGLGFSITGGIDSPVSPCDIHIYISKIIQGQD